MKRWLNFVCVIVFVFLGTFPSASESSDHADIILLTCKKTKYFGLCVTTLKSDPRCSGADPTGLATITLDAVLHKANVTFNHALTLFRGERDPVKYRKYGTCVDVYGGSVTWLLPEAARALTSKHFSTAREDAEQVASNALGCKQQFGSGNKSPFGNENTDVHDLATVAADIIGSLG